LVAIGICYSDLYRGTSSCLTQLFYQTEQVGLLAGWLVGWLAGYLVKLMLLFNTYFKITDIWLYHSGQFTIQHSWVHQYLSLFTLKATDCFLT